MTTIAERTKFPQVLLIDDCRGDAILIRMAFKRAELPGNITVAATAEIGFKILRHEGQYADAPCPDLILLDLNLPQMRGSDFLTLAKADPVLRIIPVIVMSSSKAETDLLTTYKAYANGFITKPSLPSDYDRMVEIIEDYWFQLVQTPSTHQPVPPDSRDHETTPAT